MEKIGGMTDLRAGNGVQGLGGKLMPYTYLSFSIIYFYPPVFLDDCKSRDNNLIIFYYAESVCVYML